MRVLFRVGDGDVGELDVEVLVDGVEGAADGEVVLQLDHDVLADQRLEERVEEHNEGHEGRGEGGENVVVLFEGRGRKVFVYQGAVNLIFKLGTYRLAMTTLRSLCFK